MKTCREIMNMIEKTYPKSYALEWDNVGLLVGRESKKVKKIYLALDATDEVIEEAIKEHADMLITHHPMIFSALKQVTDQNFIGARIRKLIQNDISYYAMHTNYDVLRMGDLASEKLEIHEGEVLETTWYPREEGEQERGIGVVGMLNERKTLDALAEEIKIAFDLPNVKIFGNLEKTVQKIAICPGSGKGMTAVALEKGAEVLVTGDIDHHEGIDAVAQGLLVIDAGHYGIEHIFISDLYEYIKKNIPDVDRNCAEIVQPFTVK